MFHGDLMRHVTNGKNMFISSKNYLTSENTVKKSDAHTAALYKWQYLCEVENVCHVRQDFSQWLPNDEKIYSHESILLAVALVQMWQAI